MNRPSLPRFLWFVSAVLLLCLIVAAGGWWTSRRKVIQLAADLSALEQKNIGLEEALASTTAALTAEQAVTASFSSQIEDIEGRVGDLDKLSKTDPELLRRYSQVYFLSDAYVPAALSVVPDNWLALGRKEQRVHSGVLPHLKAMLSAAKQDGADLYVLSAYRSFGEQEILKTGYLATYGSGANKFSADQGYSEHQLGTAIDFSVKSGSLDQFDQSAAFAWLAKNAYRYGFILSYPRGNVYYQSEPWHWRFVGVKLAAHLEQSGEHFYALPQREINKYLIDLFD